MSELKVSEAAVRAWRELHLQSLSTLKVAAIQTAINNELDRIAGPLVEALKNARRNKHWWEDDADVALENYHNYRKERGE